MPKIIEVGNLHDGSSAQTIEELIKYWREDADRLWKSSQEITTPECHGMIAQYQGIAWAMRQCADDLQRVTIEKDKSAEHTDGRQGEE